MLFTRCARFLRWGYRLFHPGWTTDTHAAPDGPAVYLIHHQNLYGPVHFLGLWPVETRMWSLHVFQSRALCFDQFYRYTFRERLGFRPGAAYCASKLLSHLAPRVLRSFSVIPVHRGEANLITIRASMAALAAGQSLSICPDTAYDSDDPAMGDVYTGFLMLGELYHKKTGASLPFVPVYVSKKKRLLVAGPPVFTAPGTLSDPRLREEMALAVTEAVNSLGRACGDIAPEGSTKKPLQA